MASGRALRRGSGSRRRPCGTPVPGIRGRGALRAAFRRRRPGRSAGSSRGRRGRRPPAQHRRRGWSRPSRQGNPGRPRGSDRPDSESMERLSVHHPDRAPRVVGTDATRACRRGRRPRQPAIGRRSGTPRCPTASDETTTYVQVAARRRRQRSGRPVRATTPVRWPRGRLHPVPAPAVATGSQRTRRGRDRRHVAGGVGAAHGDQHRGQTAPAHPRLRDLGSAACGDLHRRPQHPEPPRDRTPRRHVRRRAATPPPIDPRRRARPIARHRHVCGHDRRLADRTDGRCSTVSGREHRSWNARARVDPT